MKFLRRLLGAIAGLFFNLAGLAGSSDQVANWAHWLGVVHQWLENPIVWLASTLVGTTLLAYTWADYLAERTVDKAGGISKREFSASFRQWDKLSNFTVWQVAWLWNGLEPYNIETSGTAAYPTFRKLEEDLSAGLVKDAQKDSKGSWKDASLPRQALIDYAHRVGEKPDFLFPEQRNWLYRQWNSWFGYREATPDEIKAYQYLFHWYGIGHQIVPPQSVEQVRAWLNEELKAGRFVAIARPDHHGIRWPYVHIPRRFWQRFQIGLLDELRDGAKEYGSVMVRKT